MNRWKWLTDSIPTGRAAAVSMAYLAKITGLRQRELRREIEKARIDGILICSCETGYFMPETLLELRAYAIRAGSRIKTGRKCLVPFLQEIRATEGRGK